MKNLFSLVCLVVLLGVSVNVMGQSTGEAPYPGAKHQYSVNGGTTGSSSFVWSVLTSTLTDASADVTISAVGTGALTDAKVDITWKSTVTPTTVYYVQVIETASSCTNTKIMKVTIATSTFNLVASAPTTSCYDGGVSVTVPSAIPTYTHGDATLSYTVTPAGLGASETYSFTATPTITSGWTSASPTITSGNGSIASGVVTTTDNAAITIQYVISKTASNVNGESVSVADFSSSVAITLGQSSLGVTSNATGDQSASTAVSRPHTTDITTN